jgi:hypothetical protein
MNLTLTETGVYGHAEAEFAGDRITITYKKTTPEERGMIAQLVERAKKKGMTVNTIDKVGTLTALVDKAKEVIGVEKSEEEKPTKPVGDLMDILMEKKGKVVLKGDAQMVQSLALETVEEEVKNTNRIVSEAQEDGRWKVIKIGEFKPKRDDKKQAVNSHAKVGGG